MAPVFEDFGKIPRLNREMVCTEKIDGTNAQVFIEDDGVTWWAGSRNRFLDEHNDNYGFHAWCRANMEEILKLGPGRHFGEWWGNGINRGYGLKKGDRRFYLFNTSRWNADTLPPCVGVVPELYRGPFSTTVVNDLIAHLKDKGSIVSPGFMQPEGVIVFHAAGNLLFKATVENDEKPKGLSI